MERLHDPHSARPPIAVTVFPINLATLKGSFLIHSQASCSRTPCMLVHCGTSSQSPNRAQPASVHARRSALSRSLRGSYRTSQYVCFTTCSRGAVVRRLRLVNQNAKAFLQYVFTLRLFSSHVFTVIKYLLRCSSTMSACAGRPFLLYPFCLLSFCTFLLSLVNQLIETSSGRVFTF